MPLFLWLFLTYPLPGALAYFATRRPSIVDSVMDDASAITFLPATTVATNAIRLFFCVSAIEAAPILAGVQFESSNSVPGLFVWLGIPTLVLLVAQLTVRRRLLAGKDVPGRLLFVGIWTIVHGAVIAANALLGARGLPLAADRETWEWFAFWPTLPWGLVTMAFGGVLVGSARKLARWKDHASFIGST